MSGEADDRDGSSRGPITVRPPFDPTQFARDSEQRLRASEPPSTTPTTPPPALSLDVRPESLLEEWVPMLAVARSELEPALEAYTTGTMSAPATSARDARRAPKAGDSERS